MATMLAADLCFTLERPSGPPVTGHLTGRGNRLVLQVDDAAAFAGGSDAPFVRAVAEGLARRGMTVRVHQGDKHLVTIGAVRAPWWQRRFTGSARIRLGGVLGVLASARGRVKDLGSLLPDASLTPAPTLWPPVPTLVPRPRRTGTTHDASHGGGARLVLVKDSYQPGQRQPVVWLRDGLRIGSAASADVRLPGLEPIHAVLRHDEDDEWVVVAQAGVTRVHGAEITRQILRTGARLSLGDHTFAFRREEYADHGRPYGGRLGGEIGHQQTQPGRRGHVGPDF